MESQNDGCWKGPLETVESTPSAQSGSATRGSRYIGALGISRNKDSTTYVECLTDCPPNKKGFLIFKRDILCVPVDSSNLPGQH